MWTYYWLDILFSEQGIRHVRPSSQCYTGVFSAWLTVTENKKQHEQKSHSSPEDSSEGFPQSGFFSCLGSVCTPRYVSVSPELDAFPQFPEWQWRIASKPRIDPTCIWAWRWGEAQVNSSPSEKQCFKSSRRSENASISCFSLSQSSGLLGPEHLTPEICPSVEAIYHFNKRCHVCEGKRQPAARTLAVFCRVSELLSAHNEPLMGFV